MLHPDVTGLVLAGGASRRFGRDKALHPVQGRPMAARVHDALAAVARDVLVAVAPDMPALPVPARRVEDDPAGAGPLGGLRAGLRAAATPWLLVAACDLPFLTPAVLEALLARRAPGIRVVAARADGRVQPLCAAWHRDALPAVEDALRHDRLAVTALLDRLPTTLVDVDPDALRNVNRLQDLTGEAESDG